MQYTEPFAVAHKCFSPIPKELAGIGRGTFTFDWKPSFQQPRPPSLSIAQPANPATPVLPAGLVRVTDAQIASGEVSIDDSVLLNIVNIEV
jgi:hypothetical protein